ncbi:MAG: hypothetical protein BGN87_07715 [Rhizobiales bacterium 65-79]|nr:MAG: hypothetical protein BGN87_07715 [Rhizobiales bacterium 65-79]
MPPVRKDVFESDLKDKSEFRRMKACGDEIPFGKQEFGYAERAEMTNAPDLRPSQAPSGN